MSRYREPYPLGLRISARAANCLLGKGIRSIYDLLLYTEEEVLSFRNLGKKSLIEIKNELRNLGLKLIERQS